MRWKTPWKSRLFLKRKKFFSNVKRYLLSLRGSQDPLMIRVLRTRRTAPVAQCHGRYETVAALWTSFSWKFLICNGRR